MAYAQLLLPALLCCANTCDALLLSSAQCDIISLLIHMTKHQISSQVRMLQQLAADIISIHTSNQDAYTTYTLVRGEAQSLVMLNT